MSRNISITCPNPDCPLVDLETEISDISGDGCRWIGSPLEGDVLPCCGHKVTYEDQMKIDKFVYDTITDNDYDCE